MSDERDVLISRQVALKAAVEMYTAGRVAGDGVLSAAEDYADWILLPLVSRAKTPPDSDPGPQEDVPYGEEPEPTGSSGFKPHSAAPDCRCGAVMEYSPATETRSAAYFCPQKVKSRDKRVQDEQTLLHPAVWM